MMGVYDTTALYLTTEELWWPEWDLGGRPWDSEHYETWNPAASLEKFDTPMLLVTGELDFRIPYTQSLMAFTALRRRGVPARLVVLPQAGHWPGWYEMALYYTAHLEWFHRYLGGGPPPWSTEAFAGNRVFDFETGERRSPEATR
jgi:dipeptidyl aminopeptidase/acylaminoacyl peptidase